MKKKVRVKKHFKVKVVSANFAKKYLNRAGTKWVDKDPCLPKSANAQGIMFN